MLIFVDLSQKLGVLALIDEESNFPKGTDESMLEKLHSSHEVWFPISNFSFKKIDLQSNWWGAPIYTYQYLDCGKHCANEEFAIFIVLFSAFWAFTFFVSTPFIKFQLHYKR